MLEAMAAGREVSGGEKWGGGCLGRVKADTLVI